MEATAYTKLKRRIQFLEIKAECAEIKFRDVLDKTKSGRMIRDLRKRINGMKKEIKTLQFRIEMMRETIQDQGETVGAVRDAIERKRGEPQQKPILFDRGKVFLNPLAVAV